MTARGAPRPKGPARGRLRRSFWPVRRLMARFALVDEEGAQRGRDIQAIRDRLDDLTEAMRRVQRENAAILRLLDHSPREETAGLPTGPSPATPTLEVIVQEVERGARSEVITKFRPYIRHFEGRDPIVDLGCGRGEFLEIAREGGLSSYGVDTNEASVALCRSLGLDARHEELMAHLKSLLEESLGGVFCAQVVEHLPPELLPELLREIARALQPGGVALIETPNPASFATHVHSFWRDPTHTRPVPEATLSFAVRSAGLVVESRVYSSLPPPEERLKPIAADASDPELADVVARLNEQIVQLNDLLYGYQDYALVVKKPER